MNSVTPSSPWMVLALWAVTTAALVDAQGADVPQLILLNNGNVLSGVAQSQGDQLVLDRGDGSQIRIPQSQIAYRGATIEDLYRFRASRRGFRSTNVYAEDVRWCLRYGLIEHAETELKGLKTLDPTHPDGIRLERQIAAARQPRAAAPLVYPASTPEPTDVAETAPLPERLSPESFTEFAARVQPMLINRCGNAGCHRSGGEATWQLDHLGVNVRVSSRMTHRNIAAALAYIDLDNPTNSDLLAYLTREHAGGRYKPVGRASQSAEATLRQWLQQLGQASPPIVKNLSPPVADPGLAHSPLPLGMQVIAPVSAQESPAEGFSIDADGELV
ncbi:MAG: hypothetical protein ACO1RT_18190, partial [Planctomycetaceae bacterium]